MIKQIVSGLWSATPSSVRLRIVRLTQRKFTVSVAAIVTNSEGKVLILDHVLRPISSWGLPGGFIEAAEQSETAVRREILEETGMQIENVSLIRIRTIRRHIEILFKATSNGEAHVKSREIKDLGWFELDNLPEQMSRSQKSIIIETVDERLGG